MSPTLVSPAEYLNYLITHKDTILAPWIAGCCADLYAAGIYTSMVIRYFTRNAPKDTRKTTILVVLVAVLSAYKTVTALYILFLLSVVLNGEQGRLAVASLTNWVMVMTPLSTQFVDLAVQSYYVVLLWQIFRIDRGHKFPAAFRWVTLSTIFVLAVLAVIMGGLAAAEVLSLRFIRAPEFLSTQLAASFVCDAIISISTIFCLLKSDMYSSSSSKIRSTFFKIARIIALSASVPALFALFNVSIVAANIFYNRWHVLFDFALSKAFAISFMWTVEVRRNIRQAETVERNSDALRTSPVTRQFSQNFFDSRFAATVQVSRLPNNNVIELGLSQSQQPHQRHWDREREREQDVESSRDGQTVSTTAGHLSPANFLDMKG